MRSVFFFTVIFLFGITSSWAQSPVADYQLPASVCLEEEAYLENQSTNASYFEWDFCGDEFLSPPLLNGILEVNDLNLSYGQKLIYDSLRGSYYYFVTDDSDGDLLRFDFGSDLNNTPDVIKLNLNGASLNRPQSLDIVKAEDGRWVGFIGSRTNGVGVTRIEFGLDIENEQPVSVNLGTFGQNNIQIRDLRLFKENDIYYLMSLNLNDERFVITEYSNSLFDEPTNTIVSSAIPNINLANGFDVIDYNGDLIFMVAGLTSRNLVRLNFGNSILNSFVHEATYNSSNLGVTLERLASVKIQVTREGNYYIVLNPFDTGNETLFLDFGDFSQTTTPIPLNYSVGFSSLLVGGFMEGDYNYFFISNSGDVRFLKFSSDCAESIGFSTQENPSVSYSQSGTYPITLTAYDDEGNTSSITKEITVTSDVAPSVDFTVGESLCITSPVSFSGTSNQAITSWNWDFGDGETATGENPDHTFATAGTYEVVLSVNSAAGCSNTYRQEITIYEEPTVTFSYDAGTGVCTNKEIDFSNTTVVPSEATFLWSFGDGTTSTVENPQHLYEEVGDYAVELMIEFAGCSSTIQETLTVNPGPAVDFEASNICLGEATSFTNLSTGEFLTGYQWDFGDGFTASVDNPEHSFEESGTKIVMLTAETSNGCDVSISKAIEIGDLATVDFSYGLACAANTILFEDNSSVQNTNIIAYHWDFGIANATNDTASTANPEFTYTEPGVYQVRLEVETLQGCISSLTQEIEVLSSPQASIQYDAICLGEEVVFQPATTTNIINYFWELQNEEGQVLSTSLSTNFTYNFSETGRYQLRHRIQQNNLCSQEVVEQIDIKALPAPDFSVNTICAGDAYLFQNNTVLNGNSNVTYEWFVEGELFSTQETPERIFEEPGSYTISLNAIADGACVATANKTLAVIANPSPQFSLLQNVGASPFTIEVDNESVAGMENTWLLNEEEIGNTRDLDYTIQETGTYLLGLKITNENGCADSIYKQIEVLEPSLDVSIANLRLNEVEGQTQFIITVRNNGSIRVDEIQMRLDFGTFEVSENTSESFQPFSTKNVVLSTQVSTSQLSRIDAICLEASIIGEFDLSDSNATDNTICINLTETYKVMEPYPNPSSGDITIPFIVPNAGELNVFLQQTDGKVVRATNYSAKAGYNKLSVSKQNVSAGIYLLRIIYQGEERIKRVVFQ